LGDDKLENFVIWQCSQKKGKDFSQADHLGGQNGLSVEPISTNVNTECVLSKAEVRRTFRGKRREYWQRKSSLEAPRVMETRKEALPWGGTEASETRPKGKPGTSTTQPESPLMPQDGLPEPEV